MSGVEELIEDLGYYGDATTPAAAPGVARDAALQMLGPTERAVAQRLCESPAGLDVSGRGDGLAAGRHLGRGHVASHAWLGPERRSGVHRCRATREMNRDLRTVARLARRRGHTSPVITNVILHLINDLPVVVDLEALPAGGDLSVTCTNVRTVDGKRPPFVHDRNSTFVFPCSEASA